MTNSIFKLPIEFVEKKFQINDNINNDLELTTNPEHDSLYTYALNPVNNIDKMSMKLWSKYYTNDIHFLKDSQKLIKNYKNDIEFNNIDESFKIYNNLQNENNFCEKYQYIDTNIIKKLNNNTQFLQILSIYNLASPILSLALPILFLILPFFILKLQNIPISFDKYREMLSVLFSKHAIGQFFSNINNVEWDKRIYLILSLGFYVLQVYQNVNTCIKFYKNITKIHFELFNMRDYLNNTINSIDNYLNYSNDLSTYKPFNEQLLYNKDILLKYKKNLDKITEYKFRPNKLLEIGHIMKCYYQLHEHPLLTDCINYSFGFNGYVNNICGLRENINNKKINFCKYTKKKCKFKNVYFPSLINHNPVKNSYDLSCHKLITGPNAAGKTTILKSTLFNIIFSQQIGCGFYDKANINPYEYIHCYINIPDTSGRDSLFQAEARRCKEILDIIKNNPNKRHFCIFDELYSGTNPYEAIGSAFGYLKYLSNFKNINFLLTTHYIDLCKRLDSNKLINNYHMKINNNINEFEYTYKLESGISNIKGGIKVLVDLNYPEEILSNMNNIINSINI